jgi:hypothetical protein
MRQAAVDIKAAQGRLLPKPVIGAACHGPELSDLRGIVRERPLLSVAGDGDRYSLRYSAATRPAWDPCLQNTPGLSETVAHLALGQERIRRDRPVSGRVVARLGGQRFGCVGSNHLIRSDLRANLLPAYTSVDLPKCCSAVRNGCRRYATLCGHNPANVT